MNIDQFKQLKTKIEDDLIINENNAADKSLKFSTIYNRYLALYIQELKLLKNMTIEKDRLYGQLYHKFKFNNDYQLDSSKEIDAYIKTDDSYYQNCLNYQNQEIIVKYLEETLTNINNTNYRIKNYIEFLKLKMAN